MNLDGILSRVERGVQIVANQQSREDDWRDIINDHYLALCDARAWSWLERVFEFTAYPDELANAGTASAGSTLISGVATALARWVGHTLVGTESGQVFTVVHVAGTNVYVAPAYSGAPPAGEAFDVRYYRYALPQALRNVLGVMSRTDDTGKIRPLGRNVDESYNLDPDDAAGVPGGWLDEDAELDMPPWTLSAALGAGGSLPVGVVRYLYVYQQEGRLSPPSVVVSATTTTGNRTVDLTVDASPANSGVKKKVYREDLRDGVFRYLVTLDETDTSYSDDGTVARSTTDLYDDTGPYRYIRLYPRPSSETVVRVRYMLRPPRLRHATDVPVLPSMAHAGLVHAALLELCPRYGASAAQLKTHERLYDQALSRLEASEHRDEHSDRPGTPVTTRWARSRFGTASIT